MSSPREFLPECFRRRPRPPHTFTARRRRARSPTELRTASRGPVPTSPASKDRCPCAQRPLRASIRAARAGFGAPCPGLCRANRAKCPSRWAAAAQRRTRRAMPTAPTTTRASDRPPSRPKRPPSRATAKGPGAFLEALGLLAAQTCCGRPEGPPVTTNRNSTRRKSCVLVTFE